MKETVKTVIVDYGAGNLNSVQNALNFLNIPFEISSSPNSVESAAAVILPGVGAFPEAMRKLTESGVADALKKHVTVRHRYLLGICLGMQMLFDRSFEFKETKGFGFIDGQVEKMHFDGLKIPHMGWNELTFNSISPFEQDLKKRSFCYFVHSYKAVTDKENVIAYTEYGSEIPAIVGRDTVFGTQFHPEKSGQVGLQMLKNFYDWIVLEL